MSIATSNKYFKLWLASGYAICLLKLCPHLPPTWRFGVHNCIYTVTRIISSLPLKSSTWYKHKRKLDCLYSRYVWGEYTSSILTFFSLSLSLSLYSETVGWYPSCWTFQEASRWMIFIEHIIIKGGTCTDTVLSYFLQKNMGRALTNSSITLSSFMKSSSLRNEIPYSTNIFRRKSYRNGSNNGLPSKSCNKLATRVRYILISDLSGLPTCQKWSLSLVLSGICVWIREPSGLQRIPSPRTTSTYLNCFHKLRAKRKVTQEAHGNRKAKASVRRTASTERAR